MEILLYKDIILNFLTKSFSTSDYYKQVKKVIENDNSKILYSKKFFELIKNDLDEDFVLEFQSLFTRISDLGTNITSSATSNTFEEEFIHIYNESTTDVVAAIKCDAPTSTLLRAINNIALLYQQEEYNYHWIVIDIAIAHPRKTSLHNYNFKFDAEIDNFFSNIFKIPKQITVIDVFNTQCNLEHKKFDSLINNPSIRYINYLTTQKKGQRGDNDEEYRLIKEKFGKKGKMHITHPNNAHGRRIICHNIIIYSDEDFWNLQVNRSDWSIDIQYCEETASKWTERKKLYQEKKSINNRL